MTSSTNVKALIEKNINKKGKHNDKIIPVILAAISAISILTTLGILITLLLETITFFTRIPITEFLFSTTWNPTGSDPKFGIWALIIGTLKITVIATIFAVPVGLGAAIYLSEYASDRARRIIKPILEILAGIPTIVFGFFALTFVTPVLRSFISGLGEFNAISPGLVVGIMIVPLITSLSEDAMASVPNKIREGAYGLGATKLEVATKVVLPAATSGIVASIVLAISRAIGETMIVSLAAGSSPTASLSLTSSIQTMTGYNERVIMLITKQQPIASDLRMMISSLKIASDLERIGDNASSIANIRLRTKITDDYVLTRLKTMGKLAMLMLKDLDQAFKKKDTVLIREIIERDEDIDDLYSHIINATYLIDNDPFVAAQAHLAARHLERIGDHIINIAESVYFYLTGTHYEQ